MSYTYAVAGFVFTFTLDGSGNVIEIITPDLPVGGIALPGYKLTLDPGTTVAGAKAIVNQLLEMLGII